MILAGITFGISFLLFLKGLFEEAEGGGLVFLLRVKAVATGEFEVFFGLFLQGSFGGFREASIPGVGVIFREVESRRNQVNELVKEEPVVPD